LTVFSDYYSSGGFPEWNTVKKHSRKKRDEIALTVGGLISPKGEHAHWVKRKKLRSGDEIQVKIIETASADSPQERHLRPEHATPTPTQQKQYVRQMAKKFGWTVTAGRSRAGKRRK